MDAGVDPKERVYPGHGQQYRSRAPVESPDGRRKPLTNAAAELEGIDESVGR